MDVRQQLGCGPDAKPRVLATVRRNGGVRLHLVPDPGVLVVDGWLRTRFAFSREECAQSLLLSLILFFGQIIGAPLYSAFLDGKLFGGLHLPNVNAPVFEVSFYRVVLPVIVQIVLVAIPALWGFHIATRIGKLTRMVSILLWAAAIATLAVAAMPDLGFWFFLVARILHINAPAGIWAGMRAVNSVRAVAFWPIVFLIAHAITRHRLIKAPA